MLDMHLFLICNKAPVFHMHEFCGGKKEMMKRLEVKFFFSHFLYYFYETKLALHVETAVKNEYFLHFTQVSAPNKVHTKVES